MTLTRLSDAPAIGPDDILVVGCLRNEALRLPWFLTHYRNLGVDRFLLVDNGSTDGSRAFLSQRDDVTLFHTAQSYAESECGIAWQNALLGEYAIGHWVFVVDADELFIFPGCEKTGLRDLLAYVEGRGANSVLAPMLDMYSDRPICQTGYRAGEDMLACCPYFDADGYTLAPLKSDGPGLPLRGGPRHRMFWERRDRDFPSPVLRKTPLIRWSRDSALLASTHIVRGTTLADVTGLLLHFKLFQDFAENAREETERKEHFAGARQYRAYDDVMAAEADLTAFHAGSVRFRDSAQLCRLGLMLTPPGYPFLQLDLQLSGSSAAS